MSEIDSVAAAEAVLLAAIEKDIRDAVLAERARCVRLAKDPVLCLKIVRGATHPADALVKAIQSGLSEPEDRNQG